MKIITEEEFRKLELKYVGALGLDGDGAIVYYRIKGTNKYIAKEMQNGEVTEIWQKTCKIFHEF